MRKTIAKIYFTVLVAGLLYALFITLTGISVPCIYYLTTGHRCAGCGISTMFMAMLKLDFSAAFAANPLMFVLFILWNIIALLCFVGKPKFVSKPRFLYTALGVSVFSMMIFMILRF